VTQGVALGSMSMALWARPAPQMQSIASGGGAGVSPAPRRMWKLQAAAEATALGRRAYD
jgi:hypothetical protein